MEQWKWVNGEKPTHKELIRADLELGKADSILYHGSDWPMDEANARLIAAAPDLLAACKYALDAVEDSELYPQDAIDKLVTAIAKTKQ